MNMRCFNGLFVKRPRTGAVLGRAGAFFCGMGEFPNDSVFAFLREGCLERILITKLRGRGGGFCTGTLYLRG
jgi:hypothetical protein